MTDYWRLLLSDIIKDMAYAAIANGIIEDRSRNKSITSSYQRPEIDLSEIPNAETVAATLN
jgi:hypothetical protein